MDRFAEIAHRGADNLKEMLEEHSPISFEKKYMPLAETEVTWEEESSYEQQINLFNKGIKKLREQFQPFLENVVPENDKARQRIELTEFVFRYEEDEDVKDFRRVLEGKGNYEPVTVPDYRGPVGRWTGYYQKSIEREYALDQGERLFITFKGVDYIGKVYWNHRCIGEHEGFFAPFEFDVTSYYEPNGPNILTVVVENDYPILAKDYGNGRLDGDKIYAATGYGYDDPQEGWHHCPPGAGICDRVYLEVRHDVYIQDIFVRPNIDEKKAEIWVEVGSQIVDNTPIELQCAISGKNFVLDEVETIQLETEPAGPGINYYKGEVAFEAITLWTLDAPYLYNVRVSLYHQGEVVDCVDQHFGMRKFHMDETSAVKGSLFLNNQQIILRGANTMGHMQQCVMKGDYNQLIDDILIAKYANLNFYRLTQRPVQQEIYDYCDALGLMLQTDLPLFGWLRRNKVIEAVKQAGDMEKHIRCHPSSVMVTYINEPFPESWGYRRGHRSLYRYEMEEFFEMATKNVRLHNPDRVVKNVDGDYDPPTRTGLSDFHCYNLWYTNHALSIGKLHKGYLPATKKGWKIGCGEYGIEALDPVEIMMEDYPKAWIEPSAWIEDSITERPSAARPWYPDKIVNSQMYTMHGDWFEEQKTMEDWIEASQCHQARGMTLMNDAFRRNTSRLISTAVHLLIDAWPSGWMKTLVDYRRKPKRGYFALKDSFEPVRINIRTDIFTMYSDEEAEVECYILNDTHRCHELVDVVVQIADEEGCVKESYKSREELKPCTGEYVKSIRFRTPKIKGDYGQCQIVAMLFDIQGQRMNQERVTINLVASSNKPKVPVIDRYKSMKGQGRIIDGQNMESNLKSELERVQSGGTLFIEMNNIEKLYIGTKVYQAKTIGGVGADGVEGKGLTYVVPNRNHKYVQKMNKNAFSFMYDEEMDYIGYVAEKYIEGSCDTHILYTYKTPSFLETTKGRKEKLGILSEVAYGKGIIYLSTVRLAPLLDKNPQLQQLMECILGE